MIRCPYCGSHNVYALPLGDYLCDDCGEQFSKGERAPRRYKQNAIQKVSGKVLWTIKKHGPDLVNGLVKTGTKLPSLLKHATIFF